MWLDSQPRLVTFGPCATPLSPSAPIRDRIRISGLPLDYDPPSAEDDETVAFISIPDKDIA